MKSLLKDSADPYLTMLTYRSTPLPWCGLSPAELLMGRRLRANLPQVVEQLKPEWAHLKEFMRQKLQFKSKQKSDYDRRHRTHSLPPIPDDPEVWITSDRKQVISGRVTGQREMPRSYTVSIPGGSVHRNLTTTTTATDQPSTTYCSAGTEQDHDTVSDWDCYSSSNPAKVMVDFDPSPRKGDVE